MKIVCLQEKLKHGLEKTERIIGRNLALPILQNILLETTTGGLKLSSTDLEIGISTVVSGKTETQGKITVPAKTFTHFLCNLPPGNVSLELKKNTLVVRLGKYKAAFFVEKAEDFPLIPKVKKDHSFTVSSQDLVHGLSQVAVSVSFSDTRPELTGVFCSLSGSQVTFVSTDSYRLSEKNIVCDKQKDSYNFIIPVKTVHELTRVLGVEDEQVYIDVQDSQALFKTKNTEIVTRLIEGDFPQYQDIIPKEFEHEVVVRKDQFVNEVRVNSFFAGPNNDLKFVFDGPKKILFISASGSGSGESSSNLVLEKSEGTVFKEFVFNYKYLLDGLQNNEGPLLCIKINGDDNPILINTEGKNDFHYLIMPVRTS